MMTSEVKFQRPEIIHPKTRKGLDDLVDAGFLTVEDYNDYGVLVWKPTDKMKSDSPAQNLPGDFLEKNSFPITIE